MRTRLTLKPGQDGTKQLVDKYGDDLICIRFRYDENTGKRFKTVELIVETTDWIPPLQQYASDDIVTLRISAADMRLRTLVKSVGGKWRPEMKLWLVRYGCIAGGPLENYIHIDRLANRP